MLYLWFLQFLEGKEASTGVCCEDLFRVCHQPKTWMHRQLVFTVIIPGNICTIGNWHTAFHGFPQSLPANCAQIVLP